MTNAINLFRIQNNFVKFIGILNKNILRVTFCKIHLGVGWKKF